MFSESPNTNAHTYTRFPLFSLLRFQNVLLRSVFLDVLPLLSDQLGVSISSPRKRVCGFNWPFDLHRFDLILTEWRVLFSPRRLLFPPGPVPRVSVCGLCSWVFMGVAACVRIKKQTEKCVCACAIQIGEGVGFRFRVRKCVASVALLSNIFSILWSVVGVVLNTVTLGQCGESIMPYLCGLPVDVYRQV